jgi:hypothetical protein
MFKTFFKKYYFDVVSIICLTFTLPLFFYKLGQSSLVSWDEAWYAEIARNILQSGNLFSLFWNGAGYFDHPPVGFWLIAISELIFGNSEFGVRASSALFGFLSLIVTYLLGRELFNKTVGFCSAIGLSSSFWFLFRARSGNLDIFLTFFFILTFYTAVKSTKDPRFLIPFGLSFALLILTKTGIPLTIVPALIIIFWGTIFKPKQILWPIGIFLGMIGLWLTTQLLTNMSFFQRYLMIGAPGVQADTSYLDNFKLAKTYLHDGIGKWFWPGVLGTVFSLITLNKKYYIFPIFIISFFTPFIFSSKGHIWHLIPLHPFMILSFFSVVYFLGEKIVRHIDTKILNKFDFNVKLRKKLTQYLNILISLFLISFTLYITSIQINSAWVQFIDTTKYISDEQILSSEAGTSEGQFFIDDDFGPTAVWYSGKEVRQLRDEDIRRLFDKQGQFAQVRDFVLITKQYRLDDQNISPESYSVIKSDRDKILVTNLKAE